MKFNEKSHRDIKSINIEEFEFEYPEEMDITDKKLNYIDLEELLEDDLKKQKEEEELKRQKKEEELKKQKEVKLKQEMEKRNKETIFINIETTGLDYDDEILQVTIIDINGTILINKIFQPKHHNSWYEAMQKNFITPEDVKGEEYFDECIDYISNILYKKKYLVCYNYKFLYKFLKKYNIQFNHNICIFDCMESASGIIAHYENTFNYTNSYFPFKTLINTASIFGYKFSNKYFNNLEKTFAIKYIYESLMNKSSEIFKKLKEKGERNYYYALIQYKERNDDNILVTYHAKAIIKDSKAYCFEETLFYYEGVNLDHPIRYYDYQFELNINKRNVKVLQRWHERPLDFDEEKVNKIMKKYSLELEENIK